MNLLIALWIFVLGTLVGSFLNVVILRFGTGKNILGPKERSICLSCGKKLEWFELIPIVSFLFLRAKCRNCKSTISWQYPLVEFFTGLVFVAIFVKNFPNGMLFYPSSAIIIISILEVVVWCLLIVITVYDLKHKIIPDSLVYSFCILSLIIAIFFPNASLVDSILAGIAFFAFFAGLWFVSKGKWLGFGDAKLVLGVGLLLGFIQGLSALALAFWIGAIVSLVLMGLGKLMSKKVVPGGRLQRSLSVLTMKSEIPFAPFIILGTLIAFFCQVDIFRIASFF